MIDGSIRSASILAVEETKCFAIDASYIEHLTGGDQTAFLCILYKAFSEVLAERLRITDTTLIRLRMENQNLKTKLREVGKTA